MTVRILIVSAIFRRARILEKPLTDAGFDVIIATREADGFALCRRGGVDIVLLEGIQPGLDGFGFCRALKDDEALHHLPVGLITEEQEPRHRFQALSAGADECFPFPMEQGPFIRRVRSLAALWEMEEGLRRVLSVSGRERPEEMDRVPVLVLDPDKRSRDRLRDILAPAYSVTVTDQANEAAACMARERFGVVLCDLASAVGSGPMAPLLVQQLHLAGLSRRIGLIALGGQVPDLGAGAPAVGVCDGLLRPIDRNEALIRVALAARKFRMGRALTTLKSQLRPLQKEAARPSVRPDRRAA